MNGYNLIHCFQVYFHTKRYVITLTMTTKSSS